jgi:phage terminase small subunit
MKLTHKQEKFCQEIIKGNTQSDAYREAYTKSKSWKSNTVWERASVLSKNSKVIARLEELRKECEKEFKMKGKFCIG